MSVVVSELAEQPQRAIRALEVKLALAKGLESPEKNYKELVAWYDQQSLIELLRAMPRGFYAKVSSRQARSLDDQVATYGLPLPSGSPVNVPRVLDWFHNFLSKHGPKLKQIAESKDRIGELTEKKMQTEIATLESKLVSLQIDIEKKQGSAVPISEVQYAFSWLAGEWRKFGERLGKKFGADSQRFLNEFLERIERDAVNYLPGDSIAEDQPGE